jgi:hypothetical protein
MTDPTQIISAVILFIVQWIFAPLILVGMLVIAVRMTIAPSPDRSQEISKRLAFGLGLALFLLAIIINNTVTFAPSFPQSTIQATLVYVCIGAVFGFLMMGTIHLLAKTRAISLFIILLTGMSLIGLYYYVVINQSRGPILTIIIGLLVGGLAYGVFNPGLFKEF